MEKVFKFKIKDYFILKKFFLSFLPLNHFFLKKSYFLHFFKGYGVKKYQIILVKNAGKVIGFRGFIPSIYQIPIKKTHIKHNS